MSSVLDTTELRWFAAGPLPVGVRDWFFASSATIEERWDYYLLDQVADVGVKVRGGRMLELKVRQDVGAWADLGRGLTGRPEEWRKWTPTDGIVALPARGQCVGVHKVVTKRRFSVGGAELATAGPARSAGCDVEVARVVAGSAEAWTFAFAAFGPREHRCAAVLASWQTVATAAPTPPELAGELGAAMGYPQWLAQAVAAGVVNVADSASEHPGDRRRAHQPLRFHRPDAASQGGGW